MAAEERSHALLLSTIVGSAPQGMEGPALARLEARHRAIGGNALRAAVLGANDGLVSNLSLVMGVAGAALSSRTILITGLAGLVAGAFSMAMGEWVSVQGSRELYERQIAVEAEEIATFPDEEVDELALVYQAKGLGPKRRAQTRRPDHAGPAASLSTPWPAKSSASTRRSSAGRHRSRRPPRSLSSAPARSHQSSRSPSSTERPPS